MFFIPKWNSIWPYRRKSKALDRYLRLGILSPCVDSILMGAYMWSSTVRSYMDRDIQAAVVLLIFIGSSWRKGRGRGRRGNRLWGPLALPPRFAALPAYPVGASRGQATPPPVERIDASWTSTRPSKIQSNYCWNIFSKVRKHTACL